MPGSAEELLYLAISAGMLVYPVVFGFLVRTHRPILLIAASYGLPVFITLLTYGLFLPLQILDIYMVPQFMSMGYLDQLQPVIISAEWITSYGFAPLIALYLATPPILYRRYAGELECRVDTPDNRAKVKQ